MATTTSENILSNVKESLKGSIYECISLEKLLGGTANFVYRGLLKTPLEDGSNSVVIKHTEEYVASNPGFSLTATRAYFEQTILSALDELPPTSCENTTVQTPRMYQFSPELNTQIHSDLPSSLDLKTYALTHPLTRAQSQRLGHALGLWTKTFHSWANSKERDGVREKMKGNTVMRELKYNINYTMLVAMINRFPDILEKSRDVFEAVAKEFREDLDKEDGMLIHGDFWSGNALLPNEPFPNPESPLPVYIIDWELSHLSSLAFDLGQMFAELYELTYFKNIDAGVWLIDAFMRGYGSIDTDMAWKTMIHVGTHLVCWGSSVQGWGTQEQVKGVVEVGRKLVVAGWEKDRNLVEGREGSWLGCLFQ